MPDTAKLLPRIRAEWQAATGGEWFVIADEEQDSNYVGVRDLPSPQPDEEAALIECFDGPHDSRFIAHCGGDSGYIAQLLALVDTLAAGVRAVAKEPDELGNCARCLNDEGHDPECELDAALRALEKAGG